MENQSLTYLGFTIYKILFDLGDYIIPTNTELKANVQHINVADNENRNIFRAVFVITITCPEFQKFNLQIEGAGDFSINGNVSDEYYKAYTEISAPSIVFPYFRTFISNLLNQAALIPLHLPPLTFRVQNEEKID